MNNTLHADEETIQPPLCLQLYVNGDTPSETRVIEQVRSTCEESFGQNYVLTVIDVSLNPRLAREAKILITPTLVKVAPSPVQRMIGGFTEQQDVIKHLLV